MPSDTGDNVEMTPEEIAELDAMEAGEVVRDPETGAIIQEDGGFDFADADTSPPDDGYGFDDFTADANAGLGLVERAAGAVSDVADILDPSTPKVPARKPSGGTRTVSNDTTADAPPAAAAPATIYGWPDWIGLDSDANIYLFGVKMAWWVVGIALGVMYALYEIYMMIWGPKRRKKFSLAFW